MTRVRKSFAWSDSCHRFLRDFAYDWRHGGNDVQTDHDYHQQHGLCLGDAPLLHGDRIEPTSPGPKTSQAVTSSLFHQPVMPLPALAGWFVCRDVVRSGRTGPRPRPAGLELGSISTWCTSAQLRRSGPWGSNFARRTYRLGHGVDGAALSPDRRGRPGNPVAGLSSSCLAMACPKGSG